MKRNQYHPAFPPVSCTYGAPMGRRNEHPEPGEPVGRVHLRRIRWTDGAYDEGGAYWGMGEPVYCAWSRSGFRYYFRALNRGEAQRTVATLKR